MNRTFIDIERASLLLPEIETALLELLIDSVNEFLNSYIDPLIFPNPIIELACIKIIKYWSRLETNVKALTDVDIHIEFDTKYLDFSIPPDVESMLVPYVSTKSQRISSSFDFL
ncbi:MAG: hypothetical protein ACRC92_21700 [Peptostreptococcaceae bacterium]